MGYAGGQIGGGIASMVLKQNYRRRSGDTSLKAQNRNKNAKYGSYNGNSGR